MKINTRKLQESVSIDDIEQYFEREQILLDGLKDTFMDVARKIADILNRKGIDATLRLYNEYGSEILCIHFDNATDDIWWNIYDETYWIGPSLHKPSNGCKSVETFNEFYQMLDKYTDDFN